MPVYRVEIPGQGTFRVESPVELDDNQAYQAVMQQMPGMGAAPTGTKNPLMGALGRVSGLAASGIEAVAEVAERAGDFMESKIPLSNIPQEKIKSEKQLQPLFDLAGTLRQAEKNIGYSPSTKLSELADNPLNAVPFIAERIIASTPDMAAAVFAFAPYIGARTKEILDERVKNDNKTLDDATVGDVTAAAGAAFTEATLERFATARLGKGAAAQSRTGRLAKETGIQGGTESIEEGAAYLGETAGTIKGVDPMEMGERMLEGAIVGGGLGGGVQATREVLSGRKEPPPPEKEEELKALAEESAPERLAREQVIEQQETGMAAEDEALRAFEQTAETPTPAPAPAPLETRAPAPEGVPEVLETRPAPQPELPPTEEIARLREDQQRIADEMKRIEQATEKTRETSLYEFFTFRPKKAKEGETPAPVQDNRLDTKEVFDISPDKTFNLIRKKGGARVSDFISSQQLNEWLPFELRIYGTETAEELAEKEPAAEEYIKESLRNRNYLPYETQIQLQQLGLDLEQVELALEQEMTDEQLRAEANAIAADIAAEEGPVIAGEAPEEGAARGVAERPPEEGGEEITRAAAPTPEERAIADRERDLFQLQQQIPEREAAQTGDLFGAEGIEQIQPKRPTVATKPVDQLKLFDSDKETIAKPSDGAAPLIDSELKKETDVIEKALKGKTALEAAKWMAANAPRPEYRMIAKRVVDRMEKLMKAGVEFDFKIATIGDRVPIRLLSANGISVSTVDTETNELKKIAIWLNDASNPRLVGTTYDTVMHELIHSVTQGALFLGRRKAFAGTPIADVAKRLQDVREVIVKHYNSRVRDFRTGKGELTDFELRIYNGANYLSDADEVLAWSMTSREMQNYMEAIPYKKTNVWDSFVDAIRQFLGLPKSKETTLSEVLGLTNEIFALPIVERKSILGNPGAPITNNAEAQLTLFARTNIFGNAPPNPTWGRPDDTKTDDIIYVLQDKLIDTKRVISEIEKAQGKLKDRWNAYLQEELYHGRTAKQTNDFLQQELSPVLKEMDAKGFTVADVEEYMHNRHAEERNIQIAKVNPAMPDGGSGIATEKANEYLDGLDPKKKADLDSIANKIDAMTAKTRQILIQNGLEDPNTIKTWERTYKHYIPLSREEMDYELSNVGRGIGQGFSVRGPTSKRAVGSSRQVVDILANIAMQRERAIVRSEKTRVGQAVYGLAIQHPNTDFWFAVDPDAIKDPASVNQTLTGMGINPADAKNIMSEPTRAYIDSNGNLMHGINPALRGAENVLAVRVNGKDKYVFFNTKDPRALRMVTALKNLDADQLSRAMSMVARVTRYFASINTQYNPIFGVINFLRDFQGAALNLSTTPLRGKTRQVMADTLPALRGIYADLRARRAGQTPPTTGWAKLWDEFQKEGGQTGFRDQFSRTEERREALERELKRIAEGKPKQAVRAVFDWLSDYNETMENAIRLSAYKAGLDKGLTKEQAASVAKNLTVNFNRKGQIGRQVGALYAFFNASVQGTARLYETLKGPLGKQIMFGGLLLGSAQAMLLAAAGFDEDEPPDFIKERNIVIPTGDGKYVTIPMPLGFNVIPNTSRVMTEWAMSGFKDTSKRIAQMTGAFLEMFNPLGNAGWSYQTFSPTVADPIVALAENKDWTGKPIAKKDISDLDPTPGYTRAKDTASWFSKNLAEFLNYATGGTKRRPGVFSPTPDQIDYLIGQATGGVGRELMKAEQTARAAVTGEELPTYKIPLVGRFIGETKEQAAQSAKFYDNIRLLNEHENEIKGRRKDREPVDEYIRENPEARLYGAANNVERTISALRKRKSELIKKDAPKEDIRAIDKRITEIMTRFNDRVRQEKEKGK